MTSNNDDNDRNNDDNNNRAAIIEVERAKAGFFFVEESNPGVRMQIDLRNILHKSVSPYQSILVIDTYYGRTLVTDGKTQSAEHDEGIYHETLVHPPLFLRQQQSSTILRLRQVAAAAVSNDDDTRDDDNMPSSSSSSSCVVFIGGGGELATAREVLRHKSVKRVVMVDVDEALIDVCKEYLPQWGGEAVASDPRLELIVGDAYAYLMNTDETFDVIIMDISDPIEAGPGIMLYTKEFYEHAITRLNMPHGVFVTQSGTADIVQPPGTPENQSDPSCFGPIANTLSTVFDCVVPYSTNIPSFGSDWAFVMAFQAPTGQQVDDAIQHLCRPSPGTVDEFLSADIDGGADALGHYDEATHLRLFSLPKATRNALAMDDRVMTKDNPIFMY